MVSPSLLADDQPAWAPLYSVGNTPLRVPLVMQTKRRGALLLHGVSASLWWMNFLNQKGCYMQHKEWTKQKRIAEKKPSYQGADGGRLKASRV